MRRPATQRSRYLRSVATAWLLAVGLTGVLGAVQAQAAARDHACCPAPPVEAQAPDAPCPSLLPLACCDATVLPASAPAAPERDHALATPAPEVTALSAPGPAPAPPALETRPRVSPLRLSVVLRL